MRLVLTTLLTLTAAIRAADAQATINLSLSPASVRSGVPVTCTLTYTDTTPTSTTSGAQFVLTIPANVTMSAPLPTPAQGKALACNGPLCILAGNTAVPNPNPFTPGPLATFTLTPTGAPGVYPVSLTNLLGAANSGVQVSPALTTAGASITVLSRYDINSDGRVDPTDVSLALAQALNLAPCTTGDIDTDGKCTVLDVQLILLAATGKIPL